MFDFLIHSPVSHFAKTTPDHPAFIFRGETLTYRALDAASEQLAHAFVERGLKPGDRVGLFLHKGLDLGVALYGALKAGGVFVPLDPLLPVERLAFIVEDCEIRHFVTCALKVQDTRALVERLGEESPTVYGVDADLPTDVCSWDEVRSHATTPLDLPLVDLDLGYLMYTSGSTGVPKGMMHTHRGCLSYARWGAQHVGLTADDRVASHAPLHFDLSIFDFFATSQVGGTVVLVPEPVTKFPASWTQCMQNEQISVLFTVPFTLIEMLERGVLDQRDLSCLRWVLFGGEPFPPKHLRAIMRALPGVRWTNVYGPAEAPSCTCHDIPADYPNGDDDEPVPIGIVSRNSADLLLDDDDEACAVGEPGEVCIRSSTLTRGYWKRPDLNERVFFERPSFGPYPDVFFRTGDLAIRHADGLLRFLGRKDRMVKTRGYRVELDDVEAALVSHPVVAEAATFVVPDGHGSRDILAAVTLLPGHDTDDASVLLHAKSRLPPYAVPRHVDILDAFPRTTSGKIDRKQLAADRTPPSDA